MYNWMGFERYYGGGMIMMFIGIIILGIFLYLIFRGQKSEMNYPMIGYNRHQFEALEIAKIRYAKGEISLDEFENIKKNLI